MTNLVKKNIINIDDNKVYIDLGAFCKPSKMIRELVRVGYTQIQKDCKK